jgi:hypothetical protein
MENFEKLGVFYLGRELDQAAAKTGDRLVLYDSKDLCTHAVAVGMTGSGKTGLGITLLEEALIDNIPVIVIDPKGDMPNLMLTFPDLAPQDFLPWINHSEAMAAGLAPDQFARKQAETWRKGLADWGQTPDRVARLKAAAEFAVYTPGSTAGRPVSVLRSFTPPPETLKADLDLWRERIRTTTTGLLTLLDMDADPLTSREHILIANIFEQTWASGASLDLAGLIRAIQQPPLERIGVMDLESFFPAKERFDLAMRVNALLAAPGFEAWLEGDPLDIGKLLYTPQGKPRASIFTISHLNDSERMFFVTALLNELLGWMRTQSGTSSLRAVLYMDEIFGFLPPVKNPPSKDPLLALLKQARAFGLGLVLSTQNPVDLDYKALSNTGTWFIGRLQTEQDKARLLDGLEGASTVPGYDRTKLDAAISGLGKRMFLLHNVHDTQPAVFQTRWALSYLRGPMTREQIKELNTTAPSAATPVAATVASAPVASTVTTGAPILPPELKAWYIPASGAGAGLVYHPAAAGCLNVRYSNRKYGVDAEKSLSLAAQMEDMPQVLDWDQARDLNIVPSELQDQPLPGTEHASIPGPAMETKAYNKWQTEFTRWVRLNRPLTLFNAPRFKMNSEAGESEAEFRARLAQAAREKRDLEAEKLRRKYASRFNSLQNQIMRAEQAIDREQEQAKSKKFDTAISFGTAILGAFLGRKAISATSASRVGTALKTAGRTRKEMGDVERAKERAESLKEQLAQLEARLQDDIDKLETTLDPVNETLKEVRVEPRSTDIAVDFFGLVWLPFRRDASGRLIPDWA